MYNSRFIRWLLILIGILFLAGNAQANPKKIYVVFSYHKGLFWHDNEFKGLQDALKNRQCIYRTFYMDTKFHPEASWILKVSGKAIQEIKEFHPDILVGFDDNACHFVLTHFLGTSLPMVFAGVNRDPEEYGFVRKSRQHPGLNVTGVLERHYFIQTIHFFYGLLGKPVKRIGLVSDSSATSHTMISYFMKISKRHHFPIVFFKFAYSFPGWQEIIKEAQGNIDLLIIFTCEGLKGRNNQDISSDKVIAWTVKHNRIPEITFFSRYVKKGFLGGIVLTGYYQGFYAGEKIEKIFRGFAPGNIPINHPPEGTIALNIDRARTLGLKIPLGILHSATLYHQ